MSTILSLAIHNHQPVGNFAHVFESAYAQSYLPMVEALERHPAVRVALHYSGPLLDWIEASHPEFFPRVRALVERGQVEMMTGGYYEPILAAIPERDRAGQIRKMTTWLQRRLGAHPRGLWLAERVWEPHLPRSLATAGVAYTIVDDAHFRAAGLAAEQLRGVFVTEEGGLTLRVLASLRALRYLIPWHPVEEVLAFLREHGADPAPVLLMGDDGEKFGVWPGTYRHCWEDGWVERFFTALERERTWLTVLPPGEAAGRPPVGRVYLPTAAYDEMEAWALPVEAAVAYERVRRRLEDAGDEAARFLRGGFWRQFLVKYPEINTMHKKMLRVSEKVWALPPGRQRQRALDELWQGQCNCPYWHGVFGGVYLPHIRRATFAHLIAAEALADAAARTAARAATADLDADGMPEIELATPALVAWIDPQEGGSVVALDWRAGRVNLVNVL
ncbi:MAG TPA: alpha-amylase/4-alpha-glucanotransferase domain-containing protein, partial [bacterium]|nr:alpha-amylase/4-alpha-glucanotransferase domain-containing protein [bacterium]